MDRILTKVVQSTGRWVKALEGAGKQQSMRESGKAHEKVAKRTRKQQSVQERGDKSAESTGKHNAEHGNPEMCRSVESTKDG